MELILLLILFFILLPVIKTGYKVWRSVHEIKKEYRRQYAQQGQRRASEGGSANYGHSQKHKKAIDPNVGEYVEFEEISEERHVETVNDSYIDVEDTMVEDAEFEEIVDK